MTLAQATLDVLWDFDDAAGSERRLRRAAESADPVEALELSTQVARALGLQARFAEADDLLDGVAARAHVPAAVQARLALERGRLRTSAGDPDAGAALFRTAVAVAEPVGLTFLLVDALHMLAIAEPAQAVEWTGRALGVLDGTPALDARTQRWRVGLHNNLGWALLDRGDRDGGLRELRSALVAARRWGTAQQVVWAHEAIGEAQTGSDAGDP